MPLDEISLPDEKPLNDLGREMEVIMYGRSGGLALKLKYVRAELRAARSLQCMARLRLHQKRVAERVLEKQTKAAEVVQRRWRNRASARSLLSGLSDLFANLSLAAQKDHRLEQEQKAEAERLERDREEAIRARRKCINRRWQVMRSCIKELRERMLAAMRVQCMVRMHHARRMLKLRQRRKRLQMREVDDDEATRTAKVLQKRLRTHQAASKLICDQYERRHSWYTDSRLALLLSPLASAVSLLRLAYRNEARIHRYALKMAAGALAAAAATAAGTAPGAAAEAAAAEDPGLQLEASISSVSSAQKAVWEAEGKLAALEAVLNAISTAGSRGYTLDMLIKMRTDAKRGYVTCIEHVDKDAEKEAELRAGVTAIEMELGEIRGALGAVRALLQMPDLPLGLTHVLTCGQAEGLRRKLTALEAKYVTASKEAKVLADAKGYAKTGGCP